jgi:hypothetical protein
MKKQNTLCFFLEQLEFQIHRNFRNKKLKPDVG